MNKVMHAQFGAFAVTSSLLAAVITMPAFAVQDTAVDNTTVSDTTQNITTDQSATISQDATTEATSSETAAASEQSVQDLTDSIERLEEKLELLIETLETQNEQADETYTEALGVSETSTAEEEDSSLDSTYLIVAGVAVAIALGALLLISLHARQQHPQTVSEAVDAIVARNQQIYGVPQPPEA